MINFYILHNSDNLYGSEQCIEYCKASSLNGILITDELILKYRKAVISYGLDLLYERWDNKQKFWRKKF